MADIRLTFGVHPGSVDIVKGDIENLIKSLPTAEINIGISQESLKNINDSIDSITQKLKNIDTSAINPNGTMQSIQQYTGIQDVIIQSLDAIKKAAQETSAVLANIFTSTDEITGLTTFESHIKSIKLGLKDISKAVQEYSYSSSYAEGLSSDGYKYLETIYDRIKQLPEDFEAIKNKVTENLSNVKQNADTFMGDIHMRLREISEDVDAILKKISSTANADALSSNPLLNSSAKIKEITESLSNLETLLKDIGIILTQINSKELSVVNNFSAFEDRTTKVKVYREQLLEIYRIVQQYAEAYDKLGSQKGVAGNVLTALHSIPGNQISFIQELSQTLKELGTSEQTIAGMSNMNSINALTSKLKALMLTYDEVHKKMLQMQQDQSTAVSKIELPAIDRTAYEEAAKAVDNYTSSVSKMGKASNDAALKAMTANIKQAEIANSKQSNINVAIQQTTTESANSLTTAVEKLKTELSETNSQAQQFSKEINGLFDASRFTETITQIKTEFNSLFDISKVTEVVGQIKSEIESLKGSIISGIKEIQDSFASITNTSVTDINAISGNIKQIHAELQQVIEDVNNVNKIAQKTKTVDSTSSATAKRQQAEATKEAVQAETALSNAVKNTSEAEREKASANREDEKSERIKLFTMQKLFTTEENLYKMLHSNDNANDKATYTFLEEEFKRIRSAADMVRSGVLGIEDALKQLGSKNYLDAIQTVMKGLSADMEVTGSKGTLKISEIYRLVGTLKTIESKNSDLAGKQGTYDLLIEKLRVLQSVIESFERETKNGTAEVNNFELSLEQVGATGKESLEEIRTLITKFNSEIAGTVKVQVPTLTPSDLYSSLAKMRNMYNNAGEITQQTQEYKNLEHYITLTSDAIVSMEQNSLSAHEAITKAGLDGYQYMSRVKEVTSAYNAVLSETGNIEKQNAAVAKETAKAEEAMEREAISYTERQKQLLLDVQRQIRTMSNTLNSAENKNSILLNTSEYRQISGYINQFKKALDMVSNDGINISQAFEKIGPSIENSMLRAKYAVNSLNIAISETEKEIVTKVAESPLKTLEQVEAKIASLTKTLETARSKNVGIISTEEYVKVSSYLDTFNRAVNLVETAKLKGEVLSLKDAFISLNTTLEEVTSESNIALSQLSVAMTQIEKVDTPINKIQSQLESLQKQRDKSGAISGTDKYTNLAVITKQFENALKLVEDEGFRVDEAIRKVGLDVDTAFDKAKAAIGAAKLEMYNFNQELLGSGISENSLRKSLINLEGLQFKADNNNKAQASQEYNNLVNIISKVQTALGLVETKSLDVDRSLKSVGLDGSMYMEQVANIASKFNLVLIETTNEAKKADAAFKEQQTAIKEEDALVKQTYTSIKSMTDLLKQASGKGLTTGVDYDRLSMYLNLLNKMRTEYETYSGGGMAGAFEKIGGNVQNLPRFFKDAELAALQLKVAIAETTTEEKKEQTTTLSLLDAYKLLAKSKSTIYNNEAFKDEDSYKAIKANMNSLQAAVTKVEGGCKDLDTAFKEAGKDGVQVAEQLKLKMAELSSVMTMPDSKMALSSAVTKQTTLENLIRTNANKDSVVNSEEYKRAQEMATRLAEAIRLVRTEGTGINTISQAFAKLNEVEGQVKLSAEGIALAIADLKRVSGGNDLETKIMTAYKAMSKLKTEAEEYINISNSGKVAGFSAGNLTGSDTYTQFLAQYQTIENAINAIAQGGTTADNVLKNLSGTESQLFANITLLSSQIQAELKKLSAAYKEAESSARAEGQAEKSRQTEMRRASTLLASMIKAQEKWTAAATGKTSNYYKNIEGYVNNLRAAMNEFNSGNINQTQFAERVRSIGDAFRETSTAIAQAGENTVSFTSRISNVVQRFGAWFGITRIIMKVISSIKQLISASIELDDAFTQLQIVTQSTEATYENFGNTVAEVAKRTAVSMTDITNAATTYARLGYTLEEAAKLAEYTAKLQNVGDIESSDAQDAVTAIIKAYDEIDADHIEEVMNKLIQVGNGFPISVAQIAEGMNNASSALAAAGNTFDQSVALLTAANTTVNLCRVA